MNSRLVIKWLLWLTLLAMMSGGCGQLTGEGGPLQGILPANEPVEAGPLIASGTIRAVAIRIASELGGRIVTLDTAVGEEVEAGQELLLLDATPLLTKLAEAEAAVAVAQADLAVVQAGPRPEEVRAAQAALTLAEAQRDGSLAAWENTLAAIENPQELDAQIAEARTGVSLAEQSVELAEAEVAQQQLLRDQTPENSIERQVANLQVRAKEEGLAAAQAELQSAQTMLNWLWTIRSEPLALMAQAHAAEGHYRLAEAGVAIAQVRLADLEDGPTPADVAVAQATVDLAAAQADVLRAQQAQFSLASPIDGVVLEQVLRAGEIAAPAATILTIADLSQVTLVVYVPEDWIGQVILDQEAQVTVDTFPGQHFSGRVSHISDEPEFTPRNVTTAEERRNTFYAVEIRLANGERLLKPGMPAEATFVLP
jgi:multidrug efflux pump subunit AcrA (membrane-fusion protein)